MNSKEFLTRIQMKRDTSSSWVVNNPVLLDGEVVIVDTDAGAVRYKVGDGTKKFTQLPFTDENMLNLVNNKQDKLTIDTLPTSGSSNPVASGGVKDYAVPQTRTVNGKPLSSNITLVASDIDADASGSAAQALMDAKSYTDAKVGTVESTVAALSSNVASTYETQTDAAEKLQKAKDYADSVASGKADTNHRHDDRYYTETETNALLVSLETKSDASDKLAEAKSYADAAVSGLITATAVDQKMAAHNTATGTHNDIRALISDLNTKVTNFLDVDEETTDQLSEVLEMIEDNKGTIESLTTSKVSVSDIANNLTTNSAGRVLSAAQGVYIQSLINGVDNELETHATDTSNPHGVTKAQVGLSKVDNTSDADKPVSTAQAAAIADAKKAGTDAQAALTSHNTNTSAHNDLRLELKALSDRINAALDSDDTTLDQMSEVVAYIKSNKTLIDSITTGKVSVEDIVNDLVTNVANKPLSAAQGVALKALIDDVTTSLSSHTGNKSNPHGVTKSQVGLGNVPNVATNDQTPTYTAATTLETLTSGEKLSVSMGKIMKAITDLISHIGNKSNPHNVTAAQVSALPLTGGTLTGNLTGKYITGTWLQATDSDNHMTTASTKIAVIDSSGWVYYRTIAELLADLGIPDATSIRATASAYGTTKLSTSVTSTSKSLAATPYSVKTALDNAKAYTDSAIGNAIAASY